MASGLLAPSPNRRSHAGQSRHPGYAPESDGVFPGQWRKRPTASNNALPGISSQQTMAESVATDRPGLQNCIEGYHGAAPRGTPARDSPGCVTPDWVRVGRDRTRKPLTNERPPSEKSGAMI